MLDLVSLETLSERLRDGDADQLIATLDAAFRDPRMSAEHLRQLAKLGEDAAWAIRRRRDADAMDRMRLELERQASLIRRLTTTLVRNRDTMDGALSAGRAGVFECDLRDELLTWTNGVYDLFGFPTGARLHRQDVVGCYARASRRALEEARNAAIRCGSGFRLDAEIETARGDRRWIRLACVVDRQGGAPVRLYGVKQDVTEEREATERVRLLAEVDPLTGLANRRLFQEKLARLAETTGAALLLIDLDGFKQINDSLGHLTGDECLKEAAARMKRASPDAALVARIGGDEFALLFGAGLGPAELERRARDIVDALRFPVRRGDFALDLGASVGLARADGASPVDWTARADAALYAAKAAGRGTFRSFDPVMVPITAPCADEAAIPVRLFA